MRIVTAKDNEGNKGKITDTTKVTILLPELKRVFKVRGGCIWSSARWVMSVAGMVESLNAAGWSLQEAEVGRVVECNWTIVAESWGRSCLVNRCPSFDSTLGYMLHCGSVEVGRLIFRFWQYVGLTWDVSIWLLARTASRTWARCCNARAVHNSELLRGLHATLRERRGRNRCWQLGRVESCRVVRVGD